MEPFDPVAATVYARDYVRGERLTIRIFFLFLERTILSWDQEVIKSQERQAYG